MWQDWRTPTAFLRVAEIEREENFKLQHNQHCASCQQNVQFYDQDYDNAIKSLDALVEEDETNVKNWYLLGWTNFLGRKTEPGYAGKARTYLKKAVQVNKKNPSDDVDLIEHIKSLLDDLGEDDTAEEVNEAIDDLETNLTNLIQDSGTPVTVQQEDDPAKIDADNADDANDADDADDADDSNDAVCTVQQEDDSAHAQDDHAHFQGKEPQQSPRVNRCRNLNKNTLSVSNKLATDKDDHCEICGPWTANRPPELSVQSCYRNSAGTDTALALQPWRYYPVIGNLTLNALY